MDSDRTESSRPRRNTGRPSNYYEMDEAAKVVESIRPIKVSPAIPIRPPPTTAAQPTIPFDSQKSRARSFLDAMGISDESPPRRSTSTMIGHGAHGGHGGDRPQTAMASLPPARQNTIDLTAHGSAAESQYDVFKKFASSHHDQKCKEIRERGQREANRLEAKREQEKSAIREEADLRMVDIDNRMNAAVQAVAEGMEKELAEAQAEMEHWLTKFEGAPKQ